MKYLLNALIFFAFSILASNAHAQYCNTTWSQNCQDNDIIDDFSTSNGILNISNINSGCSSGGIIYYPNQTVSVIIGNSFDISVQTANSGTIWSQGFAIWIDYNDDGDFYDTGEDVWDSGTTGTQIFTGTITPPPGSGGFHRMRVKCQFNTVPTDPCGSATYGEHEDYNVLVISSIYEYPYCNNFVQDNGTFISGGILSTWEHGAPDNSIISDSYSDTAAWVTNLDGDYNNDELSYLRSPRIDLINLVDPAIRFYANFSFETGDGVAMQISDDSATTWTTLGTQGTSWFNNSSVNALNSAFGNGNGWSGSSSGWQPYQQSLSAYNGDTNLFLRWSMAADGSGTNEGYGLDNLVIGESNDISLVDLLYPDSICGNSNTNVRAVICNNSVVEKSGFGIDLDTNGTTISYSYPDTMSVCHCDTLVIATLNTSAGGSWSLEAVVNNSGDVNAVNDTVIGSFITYATPTVTVSGGGNFCDGESGTIDFSFTGTGPWNLTYTNGSGGTYVGGIVTNSIQESISVAGTYTTLFLTDSTGCPADTSNFNGSAMVTFLPKPIVDLGPDSSYCEGYELDAGAGYDAYSWNGGAATTQTLPVSTSGNMSVIVTDSIGCQGGDTVLVTKLDVPVVTIADTVICEGENFIFNAGGGGASYVWHDGSTGQVFVANSLQTVSVTVTGFNGCESSKSASITAEVANPSPTITGGPGVSPLTLDAGSGFASYLWNTGEVTQTIDALASATFTCVVNNSSGCEGEDNIDAIVWPTGVSDVASESVVNIYPNPASQFVQLEFSEEFASAAQLVELIGINGKVIKSKIVNGRMTKLDLDVPDGNYLLRVTSENKVIEKSIVVVK